MLNPSHKNTLLMLVTAVTIITMCFIKPIAQNNNYHCFADARTLFNISNFLNVISNIPFLIIGFVGLMLTSALKKEVLRLHYFLFFIGVFLTGIGSAYYHLKPNNNTLVWDRIPMTISFMAFFSVVLSKFVHQKIGKQVLIPFILLGIISVLYWSVSENKGHGDLRFYILIQFLPILLSCISLCLYKKEPSYKKYIWLMIGLYLVAKLFETFDVSVYTNTHVISGHSIKHVFAALGTLVFLVLIKKESIPT
jgi:hypothetical protein